MREQLASLAEQVAQMIRDKAVLLPGPVSAAQAECADLMARANNPQGGMVAGYLDESGTWRSSADDVRDEYLDTYHRLDCPGLLGGSER
ncbi:MAG: hypothetical protein Q4G49_01255 [Paracoccus sp. (in: a-proteobacteria)]|nr:hypothetical protein [Paracoccus sp. (in: a-proteobacteria)]